jgi:hypothetical protein
MPRLSDLVAAICFLIVGAVAMAGEYPRVLFPQGETVEFDTLSEVVVTTALVQIEVQPGVIISAERGTRLSVSAVRNAPGLVDLRINHGSPTIVDISTNAIYRVPPGQYRIDITPGATAMVSAVSGAMTDATSLPVVDDGLMPGYRLSDAIMTQQQKYLDSLKIDVRDINNVLASIIRSLVPRRP